MSWRGCATEVIRQELFFMDTIAQHVWISMDIIAQHVPVPSEVMDRLTELCRALQQWRLHQDHNSPMPIQFEKCLESGRPKVVINMEYVQHLMENGHSMVTIAFWGCPVPHSIDKWLPITCQASEHSTVGAQMLNLMNFCHTSNSGGHTHEGSARATGTSGPVGSQQGSDA